MNQTFRYRHGHSYIQSSFQTAKSDLIAVRKGKFMSRLLVNDNTLAVRLPHACGISPLVDILLPYFIRFIASAYAV
jgi:hypothetical protein